MPSDSVISVSALNRYSKILLEGDKNLQSVYVKGQISNFKNHPSGHYYFNLKDENSVVPAVMFKSANIKLRFIPEDDMNVIVRCRVTIYEAAGKYQIYVDDMQPDGTGALAIAFEQLKTRLAKEGLFDESHKKPIPKHPERIGVITAESGAAFQDIRDIITRRYPIAEIVLYSVKVQGVNASEQIAGAIKYFNDNNLADVLIVGRGGGSIEDLWAFNEEAVAYATFESEIPIISAVGHETDFTIIDFVADLRAPTPSAAAELATPNIRDVIDSINSSYKLICNSVIGRYNYELSELKKLYGILKSKNPTDYIEGLIMRFDDLSTLLFNTGKHYLDIKRSDLNVLTAKLEASDPLKILSKGYSVVTKDGKNISDSSLLNKGDIINIKMNTGNIDCEVI